MKGESLEIDACREFISYLLDTFIRAESSGTTL